MTRNGIVSAVVRALLAIVLLGSGSGVAWAVADDYRNADVVPLGTTIAGQDVSGLTLEAARAKVEREVAGPLLADVDIRVDDQARPLDPDEFVHVDVDAMLERALAPRLADSLPQRAWTRVTGAETGSEIPVLITVDEDALANWVADLAKDLDTRALDASLTVDGSQVKITPSETGRRIEQTETVSALKEALLGGMKQVKVPVRRLKPKVHEDSFGKTIVVRLSERRLYLYDGEELEKQYGVAIGTPYYPTPQGTFEIVLKRYLPTWSNPGSDWAKDMPKTIGPGPNNPLGTRALNINSPGIRIHGTTANSSIGTAASHGCMRMHRWDIEDLYPRVEVGTAVYIVP